MSQTQARDSERAFDFLRINDRPPKPRAHGVTEIRGPYYTPMGRHYLGDVLETMGGYVDALKFAGGSFSLMAPERAARVAGALPCAQRAGFDWWLYRARADPRPGSRPPLHSGMQGSGFRYYRGVQRLHH